MTAVEWLESKMPTAFKELTINKELIKQAKEMEYKQMEKAAGDWWNEGARYMCNNKRKYESFYQYYNEIYEKGDTK